MNKSEILQLLYNNVEKKAEEIYQNEINDNKDEFKDELILQLMAKCVKIGYLSGVSDESMKAYHKFGLFTEEDLKNVFLLGAECLKDMKTDPVKILEDYIKSH